MTREGEESRGLGISPGSQPQFRIKIADAVIFYCEKDFEEVEKFIARIHRDMSAVGESATIFLYDDLIQQGPALEGVDQQCKMSVQHWFYVTENLCQDESMRLHKDEQIMKSLKGRKSFIPVWSKPKDEFEELPYGIAAYAGFRADDKRLPQKLVKWFSAANHQEEKRRIQERREREKAEWVERERVRREEEARVAEERHQKRLSEVRESVRASNPEMPVPTNEYELLMRNFTQLLQRMNLQHRRSSPQGSPRRSPATPDGAMPEYLLNSLESHRSSVSGNGRNGGAKTVYNITINNPGNVTIGNAGDNMESETMLKNVAVNADNPNLNLTEHDKPPESRPMQESDRSAETSGSSFDVISGSGQGDEQGEQGSSP